ncbi:hypothetical protein FQZ97_926690 [compost metagenome]
MAQHRGEPVGREQGDLALDEPFLAQALHAAQAGGRRDAHLGGQALVGLRGVVLERVEQLEVDGVEGD